MKCSDCKHWQQEGDPEDGRCLRTISRDGIAEDKTSLATSVDLEDCGGWLVTKANFGCVQFEVK